MRRRWLVPIVPALASWLEKLKPRQEGEGAGEGASAPSGPVWPQSLPYLFELQRDTARDAGVEWKHNALRHSFNSYRVADVKKVAEVALEAGSSRRMILEDYRELVIEKAAKAWFAFTPESTKALREMAEKDRQAKILAFPANAVAKG